MVDQTSKSDPLGGSYSQRQPATNTGSNQAATGKIGTAAESKSNNSVPKVAPKRLQYVKSSDFKVLCTIATAVIGAEFVVIQNNSTQADSLAYLSALYCTVFACIVLLGSTLYFVYARNIEETYDDYEKGRKEADNRLREELERSKLKAELEHTQLENEKLRADLEREKLRAELEHMQLENEKLKADLEQTKLENALLTAQLSKSNNID